MLRILSASCFEGRLQGLRGRLSDGLCNVVGKRSPWLGVLGSLAKTNDGSPVHWGRTFFCSESGGDGSGPENPVEVCVAEEVDSAASDGTPGEAEAKALSAIVPTNPRPEDHLSVIALPLLHRPLFPGFYMPVYVKDTKLLQALEENRKRSIPYAGAFLLKNINDLKGKELLERLHDITSIQGEQVVLIGHRRLRITDIVEEDPLTVKIDHLKELPYDKDDDVLKATSFEVISTLRDILKSSSLWRDHVQTYTQHIGDFNYPRLADFGAAISGANKFLCQEVLEELDVYKRLKLTLELVKKEMEISKLQESIAKAIEEKISKEQRRFLLNEQLKAIKKELGVETDDKTALSEKFRQRLELNKERCPPHVLQVIEEELAKLQLLEASSSEFNVTRNYLDWLTADENFDVHRAQKILDEDHYGLSDVKDVYWRKIICLSGPPGVGKTSIGRSIARALSRKFYRFSVGGLADVAEIKGHRRTYIGAMPGKIVQCLKSVGTANPLVLIDEIDKLGKGHAGDPASALLELLDPEQNANFLDHYLDVPIDLSKVLFVCTANVIEMIPNPLLDRMEVITLAGYIIDEKVHIARDYLEKATREACGILPEQVKVTDAALLSLIENYCREAGVRNLQKHIEKIYRKIALKLVRQSVSSGLSSDSTVQDGNDKDSYRNSNAPGVEEVSQIVIVDEGDLPDFVGKPVFHAERIYDQTPVGVVMGLAWTAMGGSTLYIETTLVEQGEGKGSLHLTGHLGDVMKESAQIAHTVARAILLDREPDNQFFPGATPKDGPSAGCTMITSMLSLALKRPVKKDLAMTGEVTLTGRILPIGGVKEKTIAARRSGVKTIILPSANRRDFDELVANVKENLVVLFMDNYSQILEVALDDDGDEAQE
ncbi:unnamed protein product [Spirodela intermedia]|uniref:Lon protease homolog, mitochondrial n=1 Tax=Spirodela intermedia TaxID=51605 RepID=A0A7I8IW15_SPIIN|nr:unnamed protein product [Spirodela intermedia]CAA6661999.1 unnamed protein product [Spirodela intermedia]